MHTRVSEDAGKPGAVSMCSLPRAHEIITEHSQRLTNGIAVVQAISQRMAETGGVGR